MPSAARTSASPQRGAVGRSSPPGASIRAWEHYYSPSERLQTGEVDRTYVLRGKGKIPGRPPRGKRRR